MNKRFILTLTSLLALVIQVSAEDKVTIKDFAIQAGETIDVNIELENDASYTAFQFATACCGASSAITTRGPSARARPSATGRTCARARRNG